MPIRVSERAAGKAQSQATAFRAEPRAAGWQAMGGALWEFGFNITWDDFRTEKDLDWSQDFRSGCLQFCLNRAGTGQIQGSGDAVVLAPFTAGFYSQHQQRLTGTRKGGERHQFATVDLSMDFLERHLCRDQKKAASRLENLLSNQKRGRATVSEPVRLNSDHQHLLLNLRNPPVPAAAQPLWYQAKVLEIAASLMYPPEREGELFCQRQKRLNQERIQKVLGILKTELAEAPSLEEIGKRVGCSHFHLSRIFTQEMGKSIFAYLRDLRMERAAELLREAKLSVTEVAYTVGYSSSSHFSVAFHEAFGCCPGLYPLKTTSQNMAEAKRKLG